MFTMSYVLHLSSSVSSKALWPYDDPAIKDRFSKPSNRKHFDLALYEIEKDPWVEWPKSIENQTLSSVSLSSIFF